MLAALLKQLRLPNTDADAETDTDAAARTSENARKAARARWGNPHTRNTRGA